MVVAVARRGGNGGRGSSGADNPVMFFVLCVGDEQVRITVCL